MKQHRQYRSLPLDSTFPGYVPPPLFPNSVPHCSRTFFLSFIFLRVDFKKYPCKCPVIFLFMSLMWLHDESIEISQLYCYLFNFIRIVVFDCLFSLSFNMLYAYRSYENAVTGRLNYVQNLYFHFKCPSVWFCFPDAQFCMVIYDIYFSFVVNKENKSVSSKDIYFKNLASATSFWSSVPKNLRSSAV